MPIASYDGINFYGLAGTLKLLPSKQMVTSIWHDEPLASAF
jgi:hypothetical protein